MGSAPWVFTFEPLQIVPIVVVGVLYERRVRALARKGRPISGWLRASFHLGLFLALVALVSPLDWIGEERLFSIHMAQHLLLGDIAPLLCVLGLTGPVLRPVLAVRGIDRLRTLAHPLVAFPVWATTMLLWHVPTLYDAAIDNPALHALEHACFFTAGALMWAAVVEPLPGPAWFGTGAKALYVLAVRLFGTILGNVLFWSQTAFYPRYKEFPRLWGLSPVQDQNWGGALMMFEGSVVTILVFAWIFMRWAAESERRQELLEAGLEPRGGRARRPLTAAGPGEGHRPTGE